MLAEGLAFTAKGEGRVVQEGVEAAPALVVVELAVTEVVDHLADGRTAMDARGRVALARRQGRRSDPLIRAELQALAEG